MIKEEILKYFTNESVKIDYLNKAIKYSTKVELVCPNCKRQYISTYGNRFNKDGEIKGTLLCKSCATSKNSTKNKDPNKGDKFGNLTYIKRINDYIVEHSGKRYIQYECICDCGNTINVIKDNLIKGKTTQCAECKSKYLKLMSFKRGEETDPLPNTKFGHLVYLEKIYHNINGKNVQFYKCMCDCGNIVEVSKSSILNGKTSSCGCFSSRKKLRQLRIEKGSLTDPEIGETFGKLTVLKINKPNIGEEKTVECLCNCGNIITIRKSSLLNRSYTSCGHCKRIYPNWFIDRLQDNKQKELALSGELKTTDNINILCLRCKKPITIKVNNFIDISKGVQKKLGVCKVCSHHTSMKEKEIYEYLLSIGLKESDIIRNSRKIIKGLDKNSYKELDFYIPEYKLAIEYNGSYYHSDNTKQSTYHRDKFRLCEEKGIHLISIYEIDWEENKDKLKDLIKSFICPLKTIYARECKILSISEKEAEQFYISYHIQSKCILAKINYGLFYNDELVSVMGFGSSAFHNRKSKEGDYELHRFVSKSGLCIVGGASKLLKRFEHDYQPKFLLSYSWNDWFTGKLYEILGFKFDGNVQPDYYWYLNGKSINKRKCRLKDLESKYPELYKESLEKNARNKEDYIMLSLGAVKVHRSGPKRWIKEY